MIILKRLNVVRQVATEEQAAKLEKQGFTRTGGTAEEAAATVNQADLAKMGEAMFEQLDKKLQEAVAKAVPADDKGKTVKSGQKGGQKEGQNGGTDQPDSGDGAK